MDSLIATAARALARGDPVEALNRVALRADAPALALRGIAMAQLGEYPRAKALLRQAARSFGDREIVARARCIVAEAEVALVSRDLAWPMAALREAQAALEARGDAVNACYAQHLMSRWLLLTGRLDEAEDRVARLDVAPLPPVPRAMHELVVAGIAMRRLRTAGVRAALDRAGAAARAAHVPALRAEIEAAQRLLEAPAARLVIRGEERLAALADIEALLASDTLVIDACRRVVWHLGSPLPLTRRPILFTLARALGEAWPDAAPRDVLVARAFRAKHADDSHRGRLRVEMARLRACLRPVATVVATARGFALASRHGGAVGILAPRIEDENAPLLALLADGELWSSSALALALGTSARTVQRALEALDAGGRVLAFGDGRARRWAMPPVPHFPTALLLPGPLPSD